MEEYQRNTLVIDEIIDLMNDEDSKEQAFKLTGTRGTGKTVTLTAIEKALKEKVYDKIWSELTENDKEYVQMKNSNN